MKSLLKGVYRDVYPVMKKNWEEKRENFSFIIVNSNSDFSLIKVNLDCQP